MTIAMSRFETFNAFQAFARNVRRRSRFFRDDQTQQFLDAVVETSASREHELAKQSVLWRAQVGHVWNDDSLVDDSGDEIPIAIPGAFPPERMHPLPDRAHEGRVNPKGIPCLYLADDRDTALKETRPWIGCYLSVARFVTLRDLRLVDCSRDKTDVGSLHFNLTGESAEKVAWQWINYAFSEPVERADDYADYAPTQVLAEWFRANGFDGVKYGSSVGTGRNIALFELGSAKLESCELVQVQSIEMTFSPSS